MKQVLVIGAGPAGLAAALEVKGRGIEQVLLVEREDQPGGILLQCVHNGFGLHKFGEDLTGPEYAERYLSLLPGSGIEVLTGTVVLDMADRDGSIEVLLLSEKKGALKVHPDAVILAMGCRERNRGNINIPGSRPAGIMTAGLAQKIVNFEGFLPGREIVILGSGDIGLIMARRLTWEGAHIKGVVEMQPFPGGSIRNIAQCLTDFHIPLYLSHTITNIQGNSRIEAVEVSPIDIDMEPKSKGRFVLTCDCLLLSVGLVPENELSVRSGIGIDPATGGPVVDGNLMTGLPGVFACGNVLHVHDLADSVSEEAEYCGEKAAEFCRAGTVEERQHPIRAGNFVRYILPSRAVGGKPVLLSLRPLAPADDVVLIVSAGTEVLYSRKFRKVLPGTMLRVTLDVMPDQPDGIEVGFIIDGENDDRG